MYMSIVALVKFFGKIFMMIHENNPNLWRDSLPRAQTEQHKYMRGHAVIYGAPALTGATRLAAESCARMGAGLVTVLASAKIANIYRETLKPHILVRDDLGWDDDRVTAKLYGSGGMSRAVDYTDTRPTVLDADALNDLPALGGHFILTPHEGEFARIFPDIEGSREERAEAAAKRSGAIIVLKGPETIIAAPNGDIVLNTHASPALATAGTGDVLAGMITGLLAQGMRPFDAACAAVWMHGEAALKFGVGLVASDLPDMIPEIVQNLA